MNPQDIRIGHWATLCCHLDMEEIATSDTLTEIQEGIAEGIPWRVWPTRKEALLAIAQHWPENSEEREECLKMAAES